MGGDRAMGWKGDEMTRGIIQCLIRVHQILGPGFLEAVYRIALVTGLRKGLLVNFSKTMVDYRRVERA